MTDERAQPDHAVAPAARYAMGIPWSASRNVHKRFGRLEVLKGIDLTVPPRRGGGHHGASPPPAR